MMYHRRYWLPERLQEMQRFQQEMNRMFDQSVGTRYGSPSCNPLMNVYTNDENAIIQAELPGVKAEEVEISVIGETLNIRGERQGENMDGEVTYHRQERSCGKFDRSIQLPFPVNPEKVEAKMTNGILSVTLPRAEEDKPRRIQVRS